MDQWQYARGDGNPFGQDSMTTRPSGNNPIRDFNPGDWNEMQRIEGMAQNQGLIDVSLDASPAMMFGKFAPVMRSTQSMSGEMAPVIREFVGQAPQGVRNIFGSRDQLPSIIQGAKTNYKRLRDYATNPNYGSGTGHTRSKDFMLATRGLDKGLTELWKGKDITKPTPLRVNPEYVNKGRKTRTGIAHLIGGKNQDILATAQKNKYGREMSYAEDKTNRTHERTHGNEHRMGRLNEDIMNRDDGYVPRRENFQTEQEFKKAMSDFRYLGEVSEFSARGSEGRSAKNIFKQSGETDVDAWNILNKEVNANKPYVRNANYQHSSGIDNTMNNIDYVDNRNLRTQRKKINDFHDPLRPEDTKLIERRDEIMRENNIQDLPAYYDFMAKQYDSMR